MYLCLTFLFILLFKLTVIFKCFKFWHFLFNNIIWCEFILFSIKLSLFALYDWSFVTLIYKFHGRWNIYSAIFLIYKIIYIFMLNYSIIYFILVLFRLFFVFVKLFLISLLLIVFPMIDIKIFICIIQKTMNCIRSCIS